MNLLAHEIIEVRTKHLFTKHDGRVFLAYRVSYLASKNQVVSNSTKDTFLPSMQLNLG